MASTAHLRGAGPGVGCGVARRAALPPVAPKPEAGAGSGPGRASTDSVLPVTPGCRVSGVLRRAGSWQTGKVESAELSSNCQKTLNAWDIASSPSWLLARVRLAP